MRVVCPLGDRNLQCRNERLGVREPFALGQDRDRCRLVAFHLSEVEHGERAGEHAPGAGHAGDGPDFERFKAEIASLGLNGRVTLLGVRPANLLFSVLVLVGYAALLSAGITVLSLAGGLIGLASGRFSLGQVAVPVGVGIGVGTGVPIVTSVVTAVI